jgi:hypothetical protein
MLCKGDSNLITWVVWCSKKETKPALQVLDGPPELNRQERETRRTRSMTKRKRRKWTSRSSRDGSTLYPVTWMASPKLQTSLKVAKNLNSSKINSRICVAFRDCCLQREESFQNNFTNFKHIEHLVLEGIFFFWDCCCWYYYFFFQTYILKNFITYACILVLIWIF